MDAIDTIPDDEIDITALRQELLELREWQEQEGLPAMQRNEVLQNTIDIRNIQNEKLQQELDTLSIEMHHYTQEMIKLKQDNQDLLDEMNTFDRQASLPQLTSKALIEKDQCIEILQNDLEKTHAAFEMQQHRNAELLQMNTLLRAENKQYAVILDKVQKEESSLKDKIAVEADELHTLQLKFSELHREKTESDLLATQASQHAQKLSSQIHDVTSALQLQLSLSGKPGDDEKQNDELVAFGGVGPLAKNRTIKLSANQIETGPSSPMSTGGLTGLSQFPFGNTDRTEPDELYDRKRSSDGSNGGSRQSVVSLNGHPRFYAYSSEPGYFLEDGRKDSVDLNEEHDEEFEERVASLRHSWNVQHELEMRELEARVAEANAQRIAYKRQLLETRAQIKELREKVDGKEGGAETTLCKRQRPRTLQNEDGAEKNCIMMGWTVW